MGFRAVLTLGTPPKWGGASRSSKWGREGDATSDRCWPTHRTHSRRVLSSCALGAPSLARLPAPSHPPWAVSAHLSYEQMKGWGEPLSSYSRLDGVSPWSPGGFRKTPRHATDLAPVPLRPPASCLEQAPQKKHRNKN